MINEIFSEYTKKAIDRLVAEFTNASGEKPKCRVMSSIPRVIDICF